MLQFFLGLFTVNFHNSFRASFTKNLTKPDLVYNNVHCIYFRQRVCTHVKIKPYIFCAHKSNMY